MTRAACPSGAPGTQPGVRFETQQSGDGARVAVYGDLDMSATFSLEGELDRLLERESVRRLVLDLRGVEFLDSTGLRLVLQTDGRARDESVELVLVRGPDDVQRVFDLAGLTELLPFVDQPPPVPAG